MELNSNLNQLKVIKYYEHREDSKEWDWDFLLLKSTKSSRHYETNPMVVVVVFSTSNQLIEVTIIFHSISIKTHQIHWTFSSLASSLNYLIVWFVEPFNTRLQISVSKYNEGTMSWDLFLLNSIRQYWILFNL